MTARALLPALAGTVLVLGCGEGGAPVSTRLVAPTLEATDAPAWTGRTGDEPVIAVVGGLPIPASRLARALKTAPAGTDPMVVAARLADQETVAQAAAREGFGAVPGPVYERELVERLIDDRFKEKYRPEDVPATELKELFANPAVRSKYDHLNTFSVQDYQWTCCNGDPRQCNTPEVQSCFAAGQAAMEAVRVEMETRPPDPEDIPLIEEQLRNSAPRIAFQEYDFGYDWNRRQQRGSVKFDPAVVEAAVRTPKGKWTGPVRSDFGWHVLYVRDVIPEMHRDLGDPEVAKDIATFFFPRFQSRRVMEFLASLVPVDQVGALTVYFKGHEPSVQARYPVEMYIEDLREALARQTEKRQEEPL